MAFVSEFLSGLSYFITNSVAAKIPFWTVRKMYYRIKGMKIGRGSYILKDTTVVYPRGIVIGDHTYVNEHCFLDGRGGVTIGSNVTIAVYTKLITGGHRIDDDIFAYHGERIEIGDHVAIFADSIVLGGAVIEDGCVFSARSLVRRGIYGKSGIYAGNPARLVRKRKSALSYKQDTWHPVMR